MKKLLGMVALATALMIGQTARAATVDIFATQSGPGSTSWALTVNTGINLGGLSLLTGPNTSSFTINPALGSLIDAGLTGLFPDPSASVNQVLSVTDGFAAGAGLILFPAGTTGGLIGTLVATGPLTLSNNDDNNGGTAFNNNGDFFDYSIAVIPSNPVPEPASILLLAFGLAGLAIARRSA